MVRFYVIQIRLGNITIDKVPEKWRNSVQTALDNNKE